MAARVIRVSLFVVLPALILLSGALITPSWASPHGLSLSQAIERGLKKSPLIKAAEFGVAASLARTGQARSGLYPRLGIDGSFRRTTNPMWSFGMKLNQEQITRLDFDPKKLNNPDAINNFSATISLTYPLYNHGQTRVGIEQAGLSENAASMRLKRARQEVIAQVTTSYLDVLLAKEYLQVIDEALKTAKAHYHMIRDRFASGLVVKSDLLRAEVHVADLERQRFRALADIKVARSALRAAMGEKSDFNFTLTSPLEPGHAVSQDLDQWISRALALRPDLEVMRIKRQIAEKEVKKAKLAYYPGIYLSGNYEINSEELDESATNYTVGAMVQFDIFDGYQKKSRIAEAIANLHRVKSAIDQMKLGIEVEVRQAYFSARSAWKQISVARSAIAQAREALRIVRNRYENGLFTVVQLLGAETSLQQSKADYFRAIHDYRVALSRLALAAGTITDTVESTMNAAANLNTLTQQYE